jgi:hypothetical protein
MRWQGLTASVVVVLVMAGLVIGDLADGGLRRWWAGHALTTNTVAGLLVLLITVLVVDQVVRRRQLRDRSRAIAAQAAIMLGQASRSSRAVSAALAGSGDPGSTSSARLDDAVTRLRAASAPLLRLLNPEELVAVGEDGAAGAG